MKKEWNTDETFGKLPFKTLKKLEFKIKGLKTRDDAAFLQYQLLTKPEIIRCNIDFASQKGTLLFNPLDTDSEKVLETIPKEFKTEKISEKDFAYKKLVEANFHLE